MVSAERLCLGDILFCGRPSLGSLSSLFVVESGRLPPEGTTIVVVLNVDIVAQRLKIFECSCACAVAGRRGTSPEVRQRLEVVLEELFTEGVLTMRQ